MNGSYLLWLAIALFCGSLPFSVWVGRLVLKDDIRHYGDRNPGATNVLRAGSRGAALVAVLLDGFKSAIPVGLAYLYAGFDGWRLATIAVMPVVGHAFSPFLGFHGGKAVAATFGTWTGLMAWEGPVVLGLCLGATTRLLGANGWAVLSAMVGLLLYFWLTPGDWNGFLIRPPLSTLLLAWILNVLILIWTHRGDLTTRPTLRRAK